MNIALKITRRVNNALKLIRLGLGLGGDEGERGTRGRAMCAPSSEGEGYGMRWLGWPGKEGR